MYKKKGRENNLGWGENGMKLEKKKNKSEENSSCGREGIIVNAVLIHAAYISFLLLYFSSIEYKINHVQINIFPVL